MNMNLKQHDHKQGGEIADIEALELEFEQLKKVLLERPLLEREHVIRKLRTLFQKTKMQVDAKSILHDDLPDEQRAVLQEMLCLQPDEFSKAEELMKTLEGQRMTQLFVQCLKALLAEKGWGLRCTTCDLPSTISWHPDTRYKEGGRAQFSHTGPAPHGSITTIRVFQFLKKVDRRKKKKEETEE